jgi:hypothetical protein
VGAGRFGIYQTGTDPIRWLNEGLTVSPKVRLMLGYHF